MKITMRRIVTVGDLKEWLKTIPDYDDNGMANEIFVDMGKNECSQVIKIGRVGTDVLLYPASTIDADELDD